MSDRAAIQNRAAAVHLKEHPDPHPVELPTGWERPPTLAETIQRMISTAMSEQAAQDGYDKFEEFDDFDEDPEDALPESPYEYSEMIDEAPLEAVSPLEDGSPPPSSPDQPSDSPVIDPEASVAMSAPKGAPGD